MDDIGFSIQICFISASNNFKKIFKASDYTIIGKCTGSDVVEFKDNKKIMRGKISDFAKSYKQNIKGL